MQALVHTPSPSLETSIEFYENLGFHRIPHKQMTLVGDAKTRIEINPSRTARAGIKLINKSWSHEIQQLKKIVPIHPLKDRYALADPSNCWIYLIESDEELPALTVANTSILGNYMGLSLESSNIELSIKIYEALGLAQSMGSLEQGWLTLQHPNGFGLSLMKPNSCPHLFFNPSLTFFNGEKNLSVIAELRNKNIAFTEEITVFNEEGIVDNVIIRDPGGYGFFIFSD